MYRVKEILRETRDASTDREDVFHAGLSSRKGRKLHYHEQLPSAGQDAELEGEGAPVNAPESARVSGG